ncbi:hypothetical protein D9M71_378580 [compost metagenome]
MSAPTLGGAMASSGEACWKRAASSPSTRRSMGRVRSRYSTLAPRLPDQSSRLCSRSSVSCTARLSMRLAVTCRVLPALTRAASVTSSSPFSFRSPLACNVLRCTLLSRSVCTWRL